MVDVVANTVDLRLPEELLLLVFQHLDPLTLLAVRQTCRFSALTFCLVKVFKDIVSSLSEPGTS